MSKKLFVSLLVACLGLFLLNGCAKDQVVKQDETIAPAKETSAPAAVQPAPQAPPASPLKSEQIASQQVKDDSTSGLTRPGQSTETASALGSGSAVSADAARQALKRVHFDFDSYALSQSARDTLYTNAEFLLKKYTGPVRLEGNCDERGSDEYNLALGENRAKAAKNYLITLGVPESQLSIISYGKERPLDPANTEEAWAKNRRADFTVLK